MHSHRHCHGNFPIHPFCRASSDLLSSTDHVELFPVWIQLDPIYFPLHPVGMHHISLLCKPNDTDYQCCSVCLPLKSIWRGKEKKYMFILSQIHNQLYWYSVFFLITLLSGIMCSESWEFLLLIKWPGKCQFYSVCVNLGF